MSSILLYNIALPVLVVYITQSVMSVTTFRSHGYIALYLGWLMCYWGIHGWPALPFESKEVLALTFAGSSIFGLIVDSNKSVNRSILWLFFASSSFFFTFRNLIYNAWSTVEAVFWFVFLLGSVLLTIRVKHSVFIEQVAFGLLSTAIALALNGTLSFAQLSFGAAITVATAAFQTNKPAPSNLTPFVLLWTFFPQLGRHYGDLNTPLALALVASQLLCCTISNKYLRWTASTAQIGAVVLWSLRL